MRLLILLISIALSTTTLAASKQDIQQCQSLGNKIKIARCIAALKSAQLRKKTSACEKNVKCWANYHKEKAQKNCDNTFRRAATRSLSLKKIWTGQTLTHARWLSRNSATLVYFTDKSGIHLECRYNPRQPQRSRISFTQSNKAYSAGVKLGD